MAIEYALFERRLGVDTRGTLLLAEHDDENRGYEAVSWWMLPRILRKLDLGPDEVFLDVGCGKGRAVLQACLTHHFTRVIGVDLSDTLLAVARDNVNRCSSRLRCSDVVLLRADAAQWTVPDDVTVVFLFNPFRGEVFDAFFMHLLESLERHPRRLRIIYQNPLDDQAIERSGRFRLLYDRPVRRAWDRQGRLRLYEFAGTSVAA